jgi:serine/threonine protein kinase
MTSPTDREAEIFGQALDLPPGDEQANYIRRACQDDEALAARILALLRLHQNTSELDGFLPDTNPFLALNGAAVYPTAGPYRLVEKIGEGGMGIVYRAEQFEPIRRQVALKLIKPGMDTSHVLARFSAERQALALMAHPHIAKVLDGGATDDGRPYFVMELVDGRPITRFCDEERLSLRDRLILFADVCRAVQHAHQKGVIHRDLKPSNILVSAGEKTPQPKIIDFGVAKATTQPLTEQTLATGVFNVLGTPAYMSPEQADSLHQDVDTRSDVYSLGVVLYELLTGATPFDGRELLSGGIEGFRRKIRDTDPPTPSSRLDTQDGPSRSAVSERRGLDPRKLRQSLRGELDWIVMRALEKDRSRRYQSAKELADDIDRYLDGRPIAAGPPSGWYRLRKTVSRHRAALAATAAVALALLIGTGVSTWQAIRARRAEEAASLASDRAQKEAERAKQNEKMAATFQNFLVQDLLSQQTRGGQPDMTLREALERGAEAVEYRFKDQPVEEGVIRRSLGQLYNSLGDFKSADRNLWKAYELHRQHLGDEHDQTLLSGVTLAAAWAIRPNDVEHGKAREIIERCLAIQQKRFGKASPESLNSMEILATLLRDEGSDAKAIQLLDEVLALTRQSEPENDSSVQSIRFHQALVLGDVHREDEAIQIYESILRSSKDADLKWRCHYNLAVTKARTGRWQDALRHYVVGLDSMRRSKGEAHPSTVDSSKYILERMTHWQTQGHPLSAYAEGLIEEFPDKSSAWTVLGMACFVNEEWQRAAEAFEFSLKIRKNGGAAEKYLLAACYARLKDAQQSQKWYAEATNWKDLHAPHNQFLATLRVQVVQKYGLRLEPTEATHRAWRQHIARYARKRDIVLDEPAAANGKASGLLIATFYSRAAEESCVWTSDNPGRPLVIGSINFGDDLTSFEAASCTAQPIIVADSENKWQWKPTASNLLWTKVAHQADALDTEDQRLAAMKALASRLKARVAGIDGDLIAVSTPVRRYQDASQKIVDGAVFVMDGKSDPEIAIFIEIRQPEGGAPQWMIGAARLSAAEITLSLGDQLLLKHPGSPSLKPTDAYWIAVFPSPADWRSTLEAEEEPSRVIEPDKP